MQTSREEILNHARKMLRQAGEAGAQIVETTPQFGGLRCADVEKLIALGEAEWIEPGVRARLTEADV